MWAVQHNFAHFITRFLSLRFIRTLSPIHSYTRCAQQILNTQFSLKTVFRLQASSHCSQYIRQIDEHRVVQFEILSVFPLAAEMYTNVCVCVECSSNVWTVHMCVPVNIRYALISSNNNNIASVSFSSHGNIHFKNAARNFRCCCFSFLSSLQSRTQHAVPCNK